MHTCNTSLWIWLPQNILICFKPVLFAGLLNHWGHRGPAEIPRKREFTYRQVLWIAQKAGIPMKFPPAHPFNPIQPLRLAVACGNRAGAVARIFHFIWREGLPREDTATWERLGRELGIDAPQRRLADPAVKRTLMDNGTEALARGVFGVPTFMVGEALFWGLGSMDMLLDYLVHPELFTGGEMRRVANLPVGVTRR